MTEQELDNICEQTHCDCDCIQCLYRFELVGVEIPLLGVYSKVLEVRKK